jgi:hypothetical protein
MSDLTFISAAACCSPARAVCQYGSRIFDETRTYFSVGSCAELEQLVKVKQAVDRLVASRAHLAICILVYLARKYITYVQGSRFESRTASGNRKAVQIMLAILGMFQKAGVAELADARDSKSRVLH